MLRSKAFVHRNKRGNVVKVVNEHYLRDDIWCSSQVCRVCSHENPILSATPQKTNKFDMPHYVVPDTNVFVNQVRYAFNDDGVVWKLTRINRLILLNIHLCIMLLCCKLYWKKYVI
jgi:hypothetical protein